MKPVLARSGLVHPSLGMLPLAVFLNRREQAFAFHLILPINVSNSSQSFIVFGTLRVGHVAGGQSTCLTAIDGSTRQQGSTLAGLYLIGLLRNP